MFNARKYGSSAMLMAIALRWFNRTYRKTVVDLVRIRAAQTYVQAVGYARNTVIGIIAFALAMQLLAAIFVIFHIAVIWALDLNNRTRFLILAIVTGLYLLTALITAVKFMSQKRWMEASGAKDMVNSVTDRHC